MSTPRTPRTPRTPASTAKPTSAHAIGLQRSMQLLNKITGGGTLSASTPSAVFPHSPTTSPRRDFPPIPPVFGLTDVPSDQLPSPRGARTDSFRTDRVLNAATQFQDTVMKTLSALRPSTPTSTGSRAGRRNSLYSSQGFSGFEAPNLGEQLSADAVHQLQQKWASQLKTLRKDIEKLRHEMDSTDQLRKEIAKLKRDNEELKMNRTTTLQQMEQQTDQLYSNARWWVDMFASEGTLLNKAGKLSQTVDTQQEEMFELRMQLRQRTRLLNKFAREKELAEKGLLLKQRRNGELAGETLRAAKEALSLMSGLHDELKCEYCGKIFDNPQHMDPCGHVYCLKCVGRDEASNHIKCRRCEDDEVRMSTQRVLERMAARVRRRERTVGTLQMLMPQLIALAQDVDADAVTYEVDDSDLPAESETATVSADYALASADAALKEAAALPMPTAHNDEEPLSSDDETDEAFLERHADKVKADEVAASARTVVPMPHE